MPRRKELDVATAVEDGARLMSEHIKRLKKKATMSPSDFWQLDRATMSLHQLRQQTEGAIPKRVLERMAPEDLDTITTIFARYGL